MRVLLVIRIFIISFFFISCKSYNTSLSNDSYGVIRSVVKNEIIKVVDFDSIFIKNTLITENLNIIIKASLVEDYRYYNLRENDIEYMLRQTKDSELINFKKLNLKKVFRYDTPQIVKKGDTIYQSYKNLLDHTRQDVYTFSKPLFNLNHTFCLISINQNSGFSRTNIYLKKKNKWVFEKVLIQSLD